MNKKFKNGKPVEFLLKDKLMVNRTLDGEQNIFGITLNWRGQGNPDRRDGSGANDQSQGKSDTEVDSDDREEKNHRKSMLDWARQGVSHAQKTVRSSLGINVGIASLLKQSQLFTGTLGTIFQILGAMVDVVLAAFMPLIIPALKTMANSIPEIQEKMERVRIGIEKAVDWLQAANAWLKGNKWVQMLKSGLGELLQYWLIGVFIAKITGLWTPFWLLHKYFGFGILKTLGLIAKQIGFMRTGTFTEGPGDFIGPDYNSRSSRGQGWGRGAGRFGTRGVTPRTAGFGALGIAGGVGAGYAMGGGTGAAGAGGGAIAGAILGSAIPGIGTMLGATIGSVAGAILASALKAAFSENSEQIRASMSDANAVRSQLEGISIHSPVNSARQSM